MSATHSFTPFWLVLLPVLLTGCTTVDSFTDTLRAANVARTPLQGPNPDTFPYAAQWLDRPGSPRALIVLADQSERSDRYAMADGAVVSLGQHRLLATSGFATDIRWLQPERLPDPARVRGASRPVCWQAAWRASGEVQAGRYKVQGCLRDATEASDRARGETRVDEDLSVVSLATRWRQQYWFSPSGRLLRSTQQLGPGLPQWRFETFKAAPARPDAAVAAPPRWVPGPVMLTVRGLPEPVTATTAAQLSALVTPLTARDDIDWAASRLYRLDDTPRLQALQADVVTRLRALAQAWRPTQPTPADTVQRLADDIAGWTLGEPVPATLDPARLAFRPELDLALTGRRYLLRLAVAAPDLLVRGASARGRLVWENRQVLRPLLSRRGVLAGGNRDQVVAFPSQGQPLAVDLAEAAWSGVELPPGSWVFVPLAPDRLPPAWQDLPTALKELARHAIP